MEESGAFRRGVVVGMLLMIGAIAVHWMITPLRHPEATELEQVAAIVQLAVGFGGAAWLAWRQRSREKRRLTEAAGGH